MKDLISKLTQIEGKQDKPKKQLLQETKKPAPEKSIKESTFKEVFENMSSMNTMKPLPVVNQAGNNNQQLGAAFLDIDDNSPSAKALQQAVSNLASQNKAQIVVPNNPQDVPQQAGAMGQNAVQNQQNNPNNPNQQQLSEVDETENTMTVYLSLSDDDFDAEYEFDEDGDVEILGIYDPSDNNVVDTLTRNELEAVKDQIRDRLQNEKDDRGDYDYQMAKDDDFHESVNSMLKNAGIVNEVSKDTLKSYKKKAEKEYDRISGDEDVHPDEYTGPGNTHDKRAKGINMANDKLSGKAKVNVTEGKKDKLANMGVRQFDKKYPQPKDKKPAEPKDKKKVDETSVEKAQNYLSSSFKSKEDAAWKSAQARKYNPGARKDAERVLSNRMKGADRARNIINKSFKVNENNTNMKVNESMNTRINAARLEGKTHGLRGNAYHGKAYEDLEELRAYHEGYKEGLDECYMNEDSVTPGPSAASTTSSAMPTMTMEASSDTTRKAHELEDIMFQIKDLMTQSLNVVKGTPEESRARSYWYAHIITALSKDHSYLGGSMHTMEDTINALLEGEDEYGDDEYLDEYSGDFEEGNAFTGNLAKARAMGADEFDLGGDGDLEPVVEFNDVFESWGKELDSLINEGTDTNKQSLTEGMSVNISKGQANMPDSVTITANEGDAEELLGLVRNAGLGIFGEEPELEPTSAMSVQAPDMEPGMDAEIEVVDGADTMLGLMQKLSGMEVAASDDYETEEDTGEEWGFGSEEEPEEESYENTYEEQDEEESAEEETYNDSSEEEHDHSGDEEEKIEEEKDETCMECGGMMEDGHTCEDKEMVDESSFEDLLARLSKLNEGEEKDADGNFISSDDIDTFKEKVRLSDDPFEIVHDGMKGVYGEEVLDMLQQCEDEIIQDSEGMLHPDDDHEEIADRIIEKLTSSEEDMEDEFEMPDDFSSTDELADEMTEEELCEWANKAGQKGTDHAFTQDIEFMTQTIAGGLNKPKSTGQTTTPVITSQTDRQHDHENESTDDWMKLAGIKKS
jgi:hypothetical protein